MALSVGDLVEGRVVHIQDAACLARRSRHVLRSTVLHCFARLPRAQIAFYEVTRAFQTSCEEAIWLELPQQSAPVRLHGLVEDLRLGDELADLVVESLHEGSGASWPPFGRAPGAVRSVAAVAGHRYSRDTLLALRSKELKAEVRLATLSQWSEEDMEVMLLGSIQSGDLPPAWWPERPLEVKEKALALALRTAPWTFVHVLPMSFQFFHGSSMFFPWIPRFPWF